MTTRELYDIIGGDYDAAMAYLGSERLIARFVGKFPADDSLPRLFRAWESRDLAEAFSAAHEAKGMCANLYLKDLQERASQVTELLRPQNVTNSNLSYVDAQVLELHKRYDASIRAISTWLESTS